MDIKNLSNSDLIELISRLNSNFTSTQIKSELERRLNEQPQLEQIKKAGKELLTWVEIAYRPPVRDEAEAGRMVYVRLHALADLHEAIYQ